MTPMPSLSRDVALANLERQMVELAHAVGAEVPPRVCEVELVGKTGGVAYLMAKIECGASEPIGIPLAIELGGEPIGDLVPAIGALRPSLTAPTVH